ncbi:hypothetical protein JL722_2727 [Aureococcus anophagefferens]|nr:hypothetical protein JL722_2727 [Aureococcus anophagefferens]
MRIIVAQIPGAASGHRAGMMQGSIVMVRSWRLSPEARWCAGGAARRRSAQARARTTAFRNQKRYQRRRSGAPTDFGDVVDCRPGAPNSAANAARLSARASGATDVAGCPGLAVFPARPPPAQPSAPRRRVARLPPGTETNWAAPGGAAPPPANLLGDAGAPLRLVAPSYAPRAASSYRGPAAAHGASRAAAGGGLRRRAAIVNYYAPGDTMGSHVDDAEHDHAALRVAVAAAPLLVGGDARRAADTLWLRSGDAVVSPGRRGAPTRRAPRFEDACRQNFAGGPLEQRQQRRRALAPRRAARVNVNVARSTPPPGGDVGIFSPKGPGEVGAGACAWNTPKGPFPLQTACTGPVI